MFLLSMYFSTVVATPLALVTIEYSILRLNYVQYTVYKLVLTEELILTVLIKSLNYIV